MTYDAEFDAFVAGRSAALVRYGYALTGNPHDAADLTQEALVRLRAAWSRVRRRADPQGYVRITMARLHISWWRRRRREQLVDAVPDNGRADPELERATGDAGLWQVLAALPRRQRAVLVLRYYEGLTDAEIAEVLGIAKSTVRSQATRGLSRLRAAWRPTDASVQTGRV